MPLELTHTVGRSKQKPVREVGAMKSAKKGERVAKRNLVRWNGKELSEKTRKVAYDVNRRS